MADATAIPLANGAEVRFVFTDSADGDFSPKVSPSELRERQDSVVSGRWSWLQQIHGATVVTVSDEPVEGESADALVTDRPQMPISIRVADCAPVLLWSETGDSVVVAAVHAGWKGLAAGILDAAVARMRTLGARQIRWVLGPCISASNYEFGEADLETMADLFGPQVRGVTADGRPALDIDAAVRSALAVDGVNPVHNRSDPVCTAASPRHFSYRRSRDSQRQVGVIWWEPPSASASSQSGVDR